LISDFKFEFKFPGVDPRRAGMANVNKVILIGNLTRDVELKSTPKGTAVASGSLAINRSYKTDQGEKREETTYVDVEFWGRVAEIVAEYVKKGNPLYVEGRLRQESWEDKETGKKRARLKVVAENIQLLGSRNKPAAKPAESESDGAPEESGPMSRQVGPLDEDCPF
jgi:single-strand DNA-binding protein